MNRRRALIRTLPRFLLAPVLLAQAATSQEVDRPRARDLGVEVGIFPPGPWNAITDVEGVRVGQVTVIEGARVNTGVTAIRPHPGSIYHERVPAAIYVGNGFGKLLGGLSALFEGTVEATEEAIYNSLLKATTVSGMGTTAEAIDIAAVTRVLEEYNVVR